MILFSWTRRPIELLRVPFIMAAALLAASAAPAAAQFSFGSITPFSSVYMGAGTLLMDVTKLNPHFERLDLGASERPGYFTISNDGFSIGGGGYAAVLDRLLVGGEYHFADLGEEASPSGRTNALTTKYVLGTVGYAAFTAWRLNVAPFLGLGVGTAALTLRNRNGGAKVPTDLDPTFDEIVMSPGSRSVLKASYFMVQPGLRVDFLLLPQTDSRIGAVLGLHMSSSLSPNRTTWKYEGRNVFGGPDLGPSGGTFRLVMGLGGFRLGGAPGR